MRFHLGWGDLRADANDWTSAAETAAAGELFGATNKLSRGRSMREVSATYFPAVRAAIAAFRWFPPSFLRASTAADGVTVLQRCRLGPASVDAPVRVVERIDEPHRVSITVVTLRGHPERGVERYAVVVDPALGRATLTIDKAWELADPIARTAAPFATWLQAYATRRSLAWLAGRGPERGARDIRRR